MSENPDMQELLRNLQSQRARSIPQYSQDLHDWENASNVAARFRETGRGKVSLISGDDGNPWVALEMPVDFARDLLNAYLMMKANTTLPKSLRDTTEDSS